MYTWFISNVHAYAESQQQWKRKQKSGIRMEASFTFKQHIGDYRYTQSVINPKRIQSLGPNITKCMNQSSVLEHQLHMQVSNAFQLFASAD